MASDRGRPRISSHNDLYFGMSSRRMNPPQQVVTKALYPEPGANARMGVVVGVAHLTWRIAHVACTPATPTTLGGGKRNGDDHGHAARIGISVRWAARRAVLPTISTAVEVESLRQQANAGSGGGPDAGRMDWPSPKGNAARSRCPLR